jgi:transposase-like protein
MKSALNAKHFHNEEAAYAFLEDLIWPKGPVCPHCGGVERISKMQGKSTRIGTYKCYQCRKQFTVKVGTVFESSHIPLHIWLQAVALLSSSKKGISSNQLHRTLGCTLKTAWFMSHRIREAMKTLGGEPIGGAGKIVESDETYFGIRDDYVPPPPGRRRQGTGGKAKIVTLVERQGEARAFKVEDFTMETIKGLLVTYAKQGTRLMTDEGTPPYPVWHPHWASHELVKHSADEYVRGDVYTNTVESFFSTFKRGMRGTYQHCGEKHLHRYLAEFEFRYNARIALGVDDAARADRVLKGIVGKRLMYRTTN